MTRRGELITQSERKRRGLTADQSVRPLGLPRSVFRLRLEEMAKRVRKNRSLVRTLMLSGMTVEQAANYIDESGRGLFGKPLPGDDLIANDNTPQSLIR